MEHEIFEAEVDADLPKMRDFQSSRDYEAGDRTTRIVRRHYWTPTRHTDEEGTDFLNKGILHPKVLARWGEKEISFSIDENPKAKCRILAQVEDNHIFLVRKGCNEILLLHELAHFYELKKHESNHGPGFAAIFHYLVSNVLGYDAGHVLMQSYKIHKVKFDYSLLPDKKVIETPKIIAPSFNLDTEFTQVSGIKDRSGILERSRARLGSLTSSHKYAGKEYSVDNSLNSR